MDYIFLSNTVLFNGISADEIRSMMSCLGAETRKYHRGNVVCRTGDPIGHMGLVLSGGVSIENDDAWGNKSILDHVGAGEVFAESYACLPGEPLMASVVATEPSDILFLNTDRMFSVCANVCAFHSRLIRNMLTISAQKNLNLSRRIFHTSSKSIRGRLVSYLSFQALQHGSRRFDIPFNRQQLADYLSVDRSAMSNELSKMQKEGLIKFDRNHFTLIGMQTDGDV